MGLGERAMAIKKQLKTGSKVVHEGLDKKELEEHNEEVKVDFGSIVSITSTDSRESSFYSALSHDFGG
jgi:hypothetical protein